MIDQVYREELCFDHGSGYGIMNSRERELLRGMGNCYEACHADFEDTVGMVGGARGLTSERVKAMLKEMREKYGSEPDYKALRSRLPESFPL